jgi:hypothetical protein
VQVFVGFDAARDMIVVSFRGSKTLANWINDMRFAHVDTPFPECSGCFLHKGFIASYDSIAVPLFVAVGQLRAQCVPPIFLHNHIPVLNVAPAGTTPPTSWSQATPSAARWPSSPPSTSPYTTPSPPSARACTRPAPSAAVFL